MAWGITDLAGKQWSREESWDEQRQARNHKNWRMAILKGNMLVTSTTFKRAIGSIFCLPNLFFLYLWLLPPVLQTGNISGSELGQEKPWPAGSSHVFGFQSSKLRLFRGTPRLGFSSHQLIHTWHSQQILISMSAHLWGQSLLWEAVPWIC